MKVGGKKPRFASSQIKGQVESESSSNSYAKSKVPDREVIMSDANDDKSGSAYLLYASGSDDSELLIEDGKYLLSIVLYYNANNWCYN